MGTRKQLKIKSAKKYTFASRKSAIQALRQPRRVLIREPGWIRTIDTCLKRAVLYQTELRARFSLKYSSGLFIRSEHSTYLRFRIEDKCGLQQTLPGNTLRFTSGAVRCSRSHSLNDIGSKDCAWQQINFNERPSAAPTKNKNR